MLKTTLKKRELYLNRMIAFQDTELIKVITGIRRCGKSGLMKLMAQHLRDSGVHEEQIIEINFESMSIPDMDARGFYEYVKARLCVKCGTAMKSLSLLWRVISPGHRTASRS